MNGAELILKILKARNVEYVFGNPGETVYHLLDELSGYPELKYVLALHESVATAMAYGYAIASGKTGVLLIHTVVGTANAAGNLFNAYKDSVPLVVICGRKESEQFIHEPILVDDPSRMIEKFAKWNWRVSRSEDLPTALRRAFKVSMDPPSGPVFLEIPREFYTANIEPKNLPLERGFSLCKCRGDPEQIKRAAEILINAERPIIIVGRGVSKSSGVTELAELAELTGCRVYSEPGANSINFPTKHPLYLGGGDWIPKDLLNDIQLADVVLCVGCIIFRSYLGPLNQWFSKKNKIIHISDDSWEIAKSYPVDVGIIADAKLVLRDLIDTIGPLITKKKATQIKVRFKGIKETKDQIEVSKDEDARREWEKVSLTGIRLVKELGTVLEKNAIIVDGAVTNSEHLLKFLDFEPGTYIRQSGGYLGNAIGSALGAKLALPERQVICCIGDGAFMYEVQALYTAAKYNIAVPIIVFDNAGYMSTKTQLYDLDGKARKTGKYIGVSLSEPKLDFVKIAESYGIYGELIEKPEGLRAALQRVTKMDKPAVIDVMI
jgi:benzoylformate decarboxylase